MRSLTPRRNDTGPNALKVEAGVLLTEFEFCCVVQDHHSPYYKLFVSLILTKL